MNKFKKRKKKEIFLRKYKFDEKLMNGKLLLFHSKKYKGGKKRNNMKSNYEFLMHKKMPQMPYLNFISMRRAKIAKKFFVYMQTRYE